MGNPMTTKCVLANDVGGSAPNIESSDPSRRSTIQLFLAGPISVNGCGDGYETRINIRARGGFFAAGQSSLVTVRVSRDFTNDGFDFQNYLAGWQGIDGSFVINVSEGDNYVRFRHSSSNVMNQGKHAIRLILEDSSFNTEKTWRETTNRNTGATQSFTQKYRIAPTGGYIVVFDLDGSGC